MHVTDNDRMSEQPKIIKLKDRKPIIHEDLQRLAKSMRNVLRLRYPNPSERRLIASQIMSKISLDASQDMV